MGLIVSQAACATPITIEPDDYATGTVLDNVSPWVTLSTAVPPNNVATFSVWASETTSGTPAPSSTGTKTFSHVGIPFWNTSRILRMDFHEFVDEIKLDYISSGSLPAAIGRIEAYSWNNILLAVDETAPLGDNQFETLSVAAPQIAYAFAYPPADPFGGFDNLRFNVVPEPGAMVLGLLAGALGVVGCRWHRRMRFVNKAN
jgi:hypothetical protein